VTALIRRGAESGDFTDVDPSFVSRMIDGVIIEAIRSSAQGRRSLQDEPDQIASFVVRAVLAKPSRLTTVRTSADRLDA
jgi:Na+/glutamate symporter